MVDNITSFEEAFVPFVANSIAGRLCCYACHRGHDLANAEPPREILDEAIEMVRDAAQRRIGRHWQRYRAERGSDF